MCRGDSRIAALYLLLAGCGAADHRPPVPAADASSDSATTDAAAADSSQVSVSCDRRNLTCRVADPLCPADQVPQIIDHCFGPCVPIDQCRCSAPADCPHEEMYTCHNFRQRCGPYLN